MRILPKYRRWLLCFILGLPGIFIPHFDYMGPNRERFTLGWPIPSMDILVGGIPDGHLIHLQPGPETIIATAFWTILIWCAWRVCSWAVSLGYWRRLGIQWLIYAMYSILVLWFIASTLDFIRSAKEGEAMSRQEDAMGRINTTLSAK